MKSFSRMKVDKFPQYRGIEWDTKISNPDDPNFWKYGVANLIFLDHVRDKKFLLDLGCGTGGSTIFLAEKGKAEWIIGVDLVKDMIRTAKKNVIRRRLEQKICFLICDGRHLPFRLSCFDALISRGDAFCFLVPLKSAVEELKRVTKSRGVIVLEMDNRSGWKLGAKISTRFQKMPDGKIAYVVERFSKKRNHRAIFFILDSHSRIAREVASDLEFQRKGSKAWEYSLREIREETIEIRQGALTHWPTAKGLHALFRNSGFEEVQVIGDGLLMKLLLDADKDIIEAMKRNPQLFFEFEKRLVPYVNPNYAPTMILRATAP